MYEVTRPPRTHGVEEHSGQRTLAGAVVTAALTPAAVAAVAAPALTAGVALVLATVVLTRSVVTSAGEHRRDDPDEHDPPGVKRAAGAKPRSLR